MLFGEKLSLASASNILADRPLAGFIDKEELLSHPELSDLSLSNSSLNNIKLNSDFYKEVKKNGLSAEKVFQMKSKYLSNIFHEVRKTKTIEDDFLWLIKIGVLRREVDGQGLTSKVRLTPLGRIVLKNKPNFSPYAI